MFSARRTLERLALCAACALLSCESGKKVNRPVPEAFRAFTLTDDPIDRQTLEGRPWVMSVWRPGCAPCMRQLKALDAVKARYQAQGIGFIALSLDPDEGKIFEAAAKAEVDSTLAWAEGEVMGPLGLKEVPSTVFIDADTVIVAQTTGEQSAETLEKWLKVAVP